MYCRPESNLIKLFLPVFAMDASLAEKAWKVRVTVPWVWTPDILQPGAKRRKSNDGVVNGKTLFEDPSENENNRSK